MAHWLPASERSAAVIDFVSSGSCAVRARAATPRIAPLLYTRTGCFSIMVSSAHARRPFKPKPLAKVDTRIMRIGAKMQHSVMHTMHGGKHLRLRISRAAPRASPSRGSRTYSTDSTADYQSFEYQRHVTMHAAMLDKWQFLKGD